MKQPPSFNVLSRAIRDEIFVEFVLVDGRVITITCSDEQQAAALAAVDVLGLEVEFDSHSALGI